MQRISTPTRFIDKFGPGKDGFTDGNPQTGLSTTQLEAIWFDATQEEPCTVVELAGIPLDGTRHDQLWQAINAIAANHAGQYVHKAGDTMTGPLTLNGANGNINAAGNISAVGILYSDTSISTPGQVGALHCYAFDPAGQYGLAELAVGAHPTERWTLNTEPNGDFQIGLLTGGPPIQNVITINRGTRDVTIQRPTSCNGTRVQADGIVYSQFSIPTIGFGWQVAGATHLAVYVNANSGGGLQGQIILQPILFEAAQASAVTVDALDTIAAMRLGSGSHRGADGEVVPVPIGFLVNSDVGNSTPAFLVRAIQQLALRVRALEGGAATPMPA
jgi:hypothetical protein